MRVLFQKQLFYVHPTAKLKTRPSSSEIILQVRGPAEEQKADLEGGHTKGSQISAIKTQLMITLAEVPQCS